MNILVTGGFGNIGLMVVEEALRRGIDVAVFDVPSKRNRSLARKYGKRNVQAFLGSILDYDDIAKAVRGRDVVIHMAAILPPASEARPEVCKAVNVDGTRNLIRALQDSKTGAALVQVSSASVMGHTQDRKPPVMPSDPLVASDVYSGTKIEAESLVEESGLPFCILRLSAVIPTAINMKSILSMIKLLFDMPLDARCEIVFDLDAAYALVSAAEEMRKPGGILGLKGFIAGGREKACQTTVRGFLESLFIPLGLPMPDTALFPADHNSYYLDWYETKPNQDLLNYQRHSMDDWQGIIRKKYGPVLPLLPLFRKAILAWLEAKSPRKGAHKAD